METLKLSKKDINKIIEILNNGGLVAFPTDTVFGLACKMDKESISRVYEVKGRDFNKALPVMCNSKEMIERIAYINIDAEKIMERFMPGAITLVYKKKEEVEDYVTQGKDTIGIRVPDDEWILELISKLDHPIMVTSANISGNGSLLNWESVYECMKDHIEGIIMEDARGQMSSTIVDVSSDDIRILREGPISIDEIRECLG
ncbi:MAG: L-threonylcarbamoyladenylate synthase [Erysipelotrichaceae bacterium]|nr:L-threonylcarbamoyladenylate synthase [Erysipelotrichaceae bacterium]